MIAYKVNKRYWQLTPIEKIEIVRITGKSYFDHRGRSLIDTEYHRVFTNLQEAVDYALDLAHKDAQEIERQKKQVLVRVDKILEFKDKAGAE